MMRGRKRERIFKGIISLLILKALWNSPKYGYLLESEIDSKLGEKLSDGEIYSILRNMEIKRLLRSYTISEHGRIRKYYEINEAGKKFLLEHQHSLKIAAPLIEEIREFIDSANRSR